MAKNLTFRLNSQTFAVEPVKLDRSKLYGWSQTAPFDSDGKACRPAAIDEASSVIMPGGEMGLALLSSQGEWVDRSQLVAVNPQGLPLVQVPSSFEGTIDLTQTVSLETYLDHAITAVYQLTGDVATELAAQFANREAIYTFPFNYRASFDPATAFLLESEGKLFMTVGAKMTFDFMRRDNAWMEILDAEAEEETEAELDFTF